MTKKPREHHYSLDFEVFGYRIYIIYTKDIKESRSFINHKLGPCDIEKDLVGLHSYDNAVPVGYIFFAPESSIGTIVHEVSHALWQMFNYYGMDFENEILAYHFGYSVDRILEFKNKVDAKFKDFKNIPKKE